ncbi:gsl3458 [Gloeobacter violaceus PCC 7421]|uniref:Gsl3458 protein n=1 Tax=Gloeobacter violaceus (strain ATCC 29082 / PCC 7421) TaxID=251221 RepID=Q7NFR6_GLOVI|nr:gsl3458 [Gloeobacter violaceus PCC 7421]
MFSRFLASIARGCRQWAAQRRRQQAMEMELSRGRFGANPNFDSMDGFFRSKGFEAQDSSGGFDGGGDGGGGD